MREALNALKYHQEQTRPIYQTGVAIELLEAELSKPDPKLIGWRTDDYLMETNDRAKAQNWSVHHAIIPIFEGDPNTKLYALGDEK